ncbi:MAG: flagellar basal body rod protein FlgC [Gammaproteobacteria bacterium]|nr:flagellar basal body rod protein FlgC [Gammaproteobacteria bacterium]
MSLFKVFDIAGTAMNAQSVRMNVTASNLANAGSVDGDPDNVYRARQPLFSTFNDAMAGQAGVSGVRLDGIIESNAPLQVQYRPDHPSADENGNVYISNVNTVEEMVNMMSASRSYQNSIEMVNTTKDLLLQTLSLGR